MFIAMYLTGMIVAAVFTVAFLLLGGCIDDRGVWLVAAILLIIWPVFMFLVVREAFKSLNNSNEEEP